MGEFVENVIGAAPAENPRGTMHVLVPPCVHCPKLRRRKQPPLENSPVDGARLDPENVSDLTCPVHSNPPKIFRVGLVSKAKGVPLFYGSHNMQFWLRLQQPKLRRLRFFRGNCREVARRGVGSVGSLFLCVGKEGRSDGTAGWIVGKAAKCREGVRRTEAQEAAEAEKGEGGLSADGQRPPAGGGCCGVCGRRKTDVRLAEPLEQALGQTGLFVDPVMRQLGGCQRQGRGRAACACSLHSALICLWSIPACLTQSLNVL